MQRLIAATFAMLVTAGCGRDEVTDPGETTLRLTSVDGQPLPLLLYRISSTGETGTVVGGTAVQSSVGGFCAFRLVLSRVSPGNTPTEYEQPVDSECAWSGDRATARINLGSPPPWGAHDYVFRKQ